MGNLKNKSHKDGISKKHSRVKTMKSRNKQKKIKNMRKPLV